MDIKNLFTIGEMGGLFRTNIRTLRYYDDIGLLRPEAVDPKTGYRYYSARQFERMNTIKYLRTLNMPLDKIKAFFENRDTLVMEQILEEQLQETRAQLARLQAIERKLATRLEQLDYAMHAQLDQIQEKHLPARPAAVLKKEIRQGENLEYPIRELERTSQLPRPCSWKGGRLHSPGKSAGRTIRPFFRHFCPDREEDNYKGETAWLPEGDFLAIWYAGTHQDSAIYYKKLLAHMDTLGLECCGDSVEITWIDSGFTDDTEKYVTELQLPVRAKAPHL